MERISQYGIPQRNPNYNTRESNNASDGGRAPTTFEGRLRKHLPFTASWPTLLGQSERAQESQKIGDTV